MCSKFSSFAKERTDSSGFKGYCFCLSHNRLVSKAPGWENPAGVEWSDLLTHVTNKF